MSDERMVDEELYQRFFGMVGSPDEGKRISQARATKEFGVSAGLISAYKGRAYSGNVAAIEDKVRAFLDREERRISDIVIPVVETTTVSQIRQSVELAHDYKDIAVITGEAGTGKTTAIRRYEDESHAALAVYAYPGMTQQKLIVEIVRSLGVYQKGVKSVLIERIVEELRGRDIVLIIDQADYLTDASLELLRCIIVDMAGVGLMLVGLPRLNDRLRNVRDDHEQLLSRVGTFLRVERMRAADAAKVIQSVWQSSSQEVIDVLTKSAAGSVRTLVKLIGHIHRIMMVNRLDAPTAEAVNDARELVKG